MKKNRIYADTSIYGGVFDDEFMGVTKTFFDEVRKGHHILVVSEIVLQELELAPLKVRQFYADLPARSVESIDFNDEMADLRDAYITAGVISRRSEMMPLMLQQPRLPKLTLSFPGTSDIW